MKILSFHSFLPFLFTLSTVPQPQWKKDLNLENYGVINVPVADLTLYPVEYYSKTLSAEQLFKQLPLSAAQVSSKTSPCVRAHQALFNEVVKIIKTTHDQVCIEIPHLLYGIDPDTQQPLCIFWTLKKWVTPLPHLQKYDHQLQNIPPEQRTNNNSVIILTAPFYESQTQTWYSFGTRFVHNAPTDTPEEYGIRLWNYKTNKMVIAQVPKKYSMQETILDPRQARKHFLTLIHNLLENHKGIIPYVWGGSSFLYPYKKVPASLNAVSFERNEINIWTRKEPYYPHSGFDCSELIWRIAHMCNIAYPYKTTIMAEQFLEKLGPDEFPQEGDLIWLEGHIQIISNLVHNELIEASGYDAGFGKVQRAPLSHIFQDIATYQQLVEAYRKQKKIVRLTNSGTPYKEYSRCAILKLPTGIASKTQKHTIV
jgi:cell wall-associated NlpC family hydrolase